MSSSRESRDGTDIAHDAVRRQLDRIVGSAAFRSAERLRGFLRFVVEETLAGRRDGIKEYAIALAVCARPASFDPRADPIVRVDGARLRSRLRTYYETEGAHDEILIELPKGAYVPSFSRNHRPAGVREERAPIPLAVLPFVSLSPLPDHDWLGESLAEGLIHSLARLDQLHVIARSSVAHCRSRSEDGRRIGRRLHVAYVVEGSVRIADGRLRITAQLIDVPHGWLVWSEKYECPWENVFAVQDEMVASLTDALKIRLTGESTPGIFAHATDDPEAYADYLRGRYYWNQRTPEALAASLRCYEQALSRDPGCASAYAGIADTLMVMALNDQEPTLAVMPRARASAHKAIELRPGSPEALVSLGCVRSIFDWDWEGGARDFEEAIRRQPGSPTAHYLYAVVNQAPRARWAAALAAMQAALRLDPASPVLLRDLGIIHFMRRAWADAAAAWDQAEVLAPAYRGCLFWRARVALATGEPGSAVAALEARIAAGPANTRLLATMACARAGRGERDRALEIGEELAARARHGRVPPLDFATLCLGLEQWDEALDWLEKACEERAAPLYQFGVDPIYDPIRGHHRAEALRLALGLRLVTSR